MSYCFVMLGRPNQLALFPSTPSRWKDIKPPSATGLPAASNNYFEQWSALVNAADSIGWGPDDVYLHGTQAFAAAIENSGRTRWTAATITRYAKLFRFAGVDHRPHPQPDVTETCVDDPKRLWRFTMSPTTQRNAFAALITWQWPVELQTLLSLKVTDIRFSGEGFAIETAAAQHVYLKDPAELYRHWRKTLTPFNTRWLFCTTRPSPSTQPGDKLSVRGFQAAFARHVKTAGLTLSWKQYRSAALRQPHADLTSIQRGVTTALRERATKQVGPNLFDETMQKIWQQQMF